MPKKGFEEIRERMLESAKGGIRSAYQSEEYVLMQAVNAYLETNRSLNLAYERLSEWFGIYLPEVKMASPETLAKLVMAVQSSGKDEAAINEAIGDAGRAGEIHNKLLSTIGRAMDGEDSSAISEFAQMTLDMSDSLKRLDSYIKKASTRVMPNTTYLTDHMIAAELLSRAGSMERLATMPASTVQLLGAEKALFKHIKFGSRPPKYGILFKIPEITNAPREIRGRIARVYATKICIALKADHFSKNFIAERLKKDLNESIKRIREKPIKPKNEAPAEGFKRRGFQRRMGRNNPAGKRGWRQNFRRNP
ncbi:MAG: NOP58 family protein [Candidatus Marsarchaeota archaeon]|nr:NOP58 family protein [Candidatus Marsarchaeota archaeon]